MSIPLVDHAFLPEYESQLIIIEIVGMMITFIIHLFIGVIAYLKMRSTESKFRVELVFLFFVCFITALLFTGGRVSANIIYLISGANPLTPMIFLICEYIYYFFVDMLFVTLVIRLYVVFKGTSLEMTKKTVYSFVILLVFWNILLIFCGFGLYYAEYVNEKTGTILYYSALFPSFVLYVAGAALAVQLFVKNLSTVAKMQNLSPRASSKQADDIPLNAKQMNVLRLSAKYILLYFVAVFSSGLAFSLFHIVSQEYSGIFFSVDLCVNLSCLYLQFAFAKRHYLKCCGCLDSRCSAIVLKKTKMEMHRESMSVGQARTRTSAASVSETGDQK